MRFAQLQLIRYGRFADCNLVFPSGDWSVTPPGVGSRVSYLATLKKYASTATCRSIVGAGFSPGGSSVKSTADNTGPKHQQLAPLASRLPHHMNLLGSQFGAAVRSLRHGKRRHTYGVCIG